MQLGKNIFTTFWKRFKLSLMKLRRRDNLHKSGQKSKHMDNLEIDFENNIVNINDKYAGELVRFENKYNGRAIMVVVNYPDGTEKKIIF